MKSFIASKNEKITEQAFTSGIVTSVLSIVLCIAALCSTSWAWFTGSTESNNNEITTAQTFELTLVLEDGSSVEVPIDDDKATLEAGTYKVTLSLPKDSASGYVVITDAAKKNYRSDYILRHENENPQTITFTLVVEAEQTLTFTKRWGIYTGEPTVENGETLTIGASSASESN